MQPIFRRGLQAAFVLLVLVLANGQAGAEPNRVNFPPKLDELVHYATVKRGNVTEHMLTSREALAAIKAGQPVPNGTHVVLVDYREGAVHRYFIMEKGVGWGADYEARRRTGDWQFQWFNPDKSINMNENTARCQSCHQGREASQFMYTFSDARDFK